jgi:NitT/TauT family transport system substrate-binding protein
MQMLLSNNVQAATLPEPLASIALGKGARLLVSDADSETSLSQTVIVFRVQALTENKATVASFFRAYRQAVRAINGDPEHYRTLFVEKGRIPADLAPNYPIPQYPEPTPFSRALFEPVRDWLVLRQLTGSLSYEQMVVLDFMEPID